MRRSTAYNHWLLALLLCFGFTPGTLAQGLGKAALAPNLRAAMLALPSREAPARASPARAANFHPAHAPKRLTMSPVQRRAWLALDLAEHGAAFFDARTTRQAMRHYHELDPLLRPFAHSAALYPAMQLAPFGLDWLATRLAVSRHRWLRRLWWLPQAAATAGFVWSAMHNLSLPPAPALPPTQGLPAP